MGDRSKNTTHFGSSKQSTKRSSIISSAELNRQELDTLVANLIKPEHLDNHPKIYRVSRINIDILAIPG